MKLSKFGPPALGMLTSTITYGDVASGTLEHATFTYTSDVTTSPMVKPPETEDEVESVISKKVVPRNSIIDTWDETAKARFGVLSKRLALQTITPKEEVEYRNLKALRRHDNPSRTFEEIRSDIEFHRAVEGAIAAIQKLMNHGTRSYFPPT